MKSRYVIVEDALGWRVGKVAAGQVVWREADGEDAPARRLAGALGDLGYRREPVCLAVSTQRVFAAAVETASLPRRQRRAAMVYRLEAQLPVDIEALAVDFLPATPGQALGVAVRAQPLRELIDALSDEGVKVAAICPAGLLALWQVLREGGDGRYVLLAGRNGGDLFRLHDGRPSAWYSPDDHGEAVLRALRADQFSHRAEDRPAALWAVAPASVLEALARGEPALQTRAASQEDPAILAALAAAALLDGESAGWVDLRRDDLAGGDGLSRAGRPARVTAVLAALAVLVAIGAMILRGARYERQARLDIAAGERIYRDLHGMGDDTPIYFSVPRRLESERRRLEGVSGSGADLPVQPQALRTLHRVLTALPADVRFRILELRLAPGDLFIEGETRSHGDSEALRAALTAAGVDLAPPRTEALPDRKVRFSLSGSPDGVGELARGGPRP